MRRVLATVIAAVFVLLAAAGPAQADVKKLVIRDPGFLFNVTCSGFCSSGVAQTYNGATVQVGIKCPAGEFYQLDVRVKQDTGTGQAGAGGDCTGNLEERLVEVVADSGYFVEGPALVRAKAFSSEVSPFAPDWDIKTERRIALIQGAPGS